MKDPSINGLILAGGDSSRMGKDKAGLNYHGRPQALVAFGLLEPFCHEVYLSVRSAYRGDLPHIRDNDAYADIGPAAGILSAFETRPAAWLVLGVDYPLITGRDIEWLLANRDADKPATAYRNREGFYEPMICLYEPAFYPLLKQALKDPAISLQKMLRECGANAVEALSPDSLRSFDTPEDFISFTSPDHA